jgi:hypothetical protein
MRKAERASGREVYASHEWTRSRSKTVPPVWPASAITPTCLVRSVLTPSRHTQEAWLPRGRAVSFFLSRSLSLWLAITLPTSNRLPRTRKDQVAGRTTILQTSSRFSHILDLSARTSMHDLLTTRLAPRSPAGRGARPPCVCRGSTWLHQVEPRSLLVYKKSSARFHHNHPNDG